MASTYNVVNDHYSRLARETTEVHADNVQKVAISFGYSAEELSSIPEGANLGVSCGNPIAVAGLKEGETIVDLGSGAGFDVFLAARKVGRLGLAIGVDMSKDMLARAGLNAAKSNISNVKFVESFITEIDLPSDSSDCIISNCVINLVPKTDKPLVFQEIFRILKPGGRVAVSDILSKKPIPENLLQNMSLYVGCISGASEVGEYEEYLKHAGFESVLIVDKKNDLNIYKENDILIEGQGGKGEEKVAGKALCCGAEVEKVEPRSTSCCGISKVHENESVDLTDIDFNEWVGSFSIYAIKPSNPTTQ